MGSFSFYNPAISRFPPLVFPLLFACKKLKIAQQLLTFICAYSDAFCGLKNVNSDVSEDLLIATNF